MLLCLCMRAVHRAQVDHGEVRVHPAATLSKVFAFPAVQVDRLADVALVAGEEQGIQMTGPNVVFLIPPE